MVDFIRRKDAIEAVAKGFEPFYWDNIIRRISSCVNDINNIPSIEEKTGEWEERYVDDESPFFRRRFYCSHCGEWNTYGMSKYCPECGAKMRREDDD